MSEENVEPVRQFLATAIEVDEGLAEQARLRVFGPPDAPFYFSDEAVPLARGIDEFLEFRAAWIEPYDDYSYTAERILDAGADRVVATFKQRGRLRDTHDWVDMHYGIVYVVDHGLITEALMYPTQRVALEAAGRSE